MGFGVPLYNSCICIYFFLVLVMHKDPQHINRWVEALMHTVPLGFALSTAFTGVALDLFNSQAGQYCWLAPSPYDCYWNQLVDCTRGSHDLIYLYMFAGLPVFLGFAVCILSLLVISINFGWERVSKKHRKKEREQPQVFDPVSSYFSKEYSVDSDDVENMKNISNMDMTASTNKERTTSSSIVLRIASSLNTKNDVDDENTECFIYTQACLYVFAFVITYVWLGMTTLASLTTYNVEPEIHRNNRFFWPLQGFWNFVIFVRPVYHHMRKKEKGTNWFFVTYWNALKHLLTGGAKPKRSISKARAKRNEAIMNALRRSALNSKAFSTHGSTDAVVSTDFNRRMSSMESSDRTTNLGSSLQTTATQLTVSAQPPSVGATTCNGQNTD